VPAHVLHLHAVTDRFRTNGRLDLGLPIQRVTVLSFLLPHWVLPWLESDPSADLGTVRDAKISAHGRRGALPAGRARLVLLCNRL